TPGNTPAPEASAHGAPLIMPEPEKVRQSSEMSVSASENGVNDVTVKNVPEEEPDNKSEVRNQNLRPADLSEALERIGETRVSLKGILEQCRAYISDDRKHVVIGASRFTLSLLKPEINSDIIRSALIVTGTADQDARLEFRAEETKQAQLGIDDLFVQ
ncbi:MAG: hypothetical protein IJU57_00430, partial [Clostridia bacterium]|nr:hypothetical protein [Clostridia bacterium]